MEWGKIESSEIEYEEFSESVQLIRKRKRKVTIHTTAFRVRKKIIFPVGRSKRRRKRKRKRERGNSKGRTIKK
jgi:hypothetical protein